jgi:hypothetical protein
MANILNALDKFAAISGRDDSSQPRAGANDVIDLAQGQSSGFAPFNGSPYREPGLT